jgi:hypothetical protein
VVEAGITVWSIGGAGGGGPGGIGLAGTRLSARTM